MICISAISPQEPINEPAPTNPYLAGSLGVACMCRQSNRRVTAYGRRRDRCNECGRVRPKIVNKHMARRTFACESEKHLVTRPNWVYLTTSKTPRLYQICHMSSPPIYVHYYAADNSELLHQVSPDGPHTSPLAVNVHRYRRQQARDLDAADGHKDILAPIRVEPAVEEQ